MKYKICFLLIVFGMLSWKAWADSEARCNNPSAIRCPTVETSHDVVSERIHNMCGRFEEDRDGLEKQIEELEALVRVLQSGDVDAIRNADEQFTRDMATVEATFEEAIRRAGKRVNTCIKTGGFDPRR